MADKEGRRRPTQTEMRRIFLRNNRDDPIIKSQRLERRGRYGEAADELLNYLMAPIPSRMERLVVDLDYRRLLRLAREHGQKPPK